MKSDQEIIASLILGGIVGAGLGALISTKKEEGIAIGAIAGAALLATFKANEKAMQTHVPMFIEENGNLYEIQLNGIKKFIRTLEKPLIKLQKKFRLE